MERRLVLTPRSGTQQRRRTLESQLLLGHDDASRPQRCTVGRTRIAAANTWPTGGRWWTGTRCRTATPPPLPSRYENKSGTFGN